MPLLQLDAFKANLNDIAKPNRFYVQFTGDPVNLNEADYYFVKGAAIPGKSFGEIELNWMGYKYKIAGDPVFNDINITFYNDIPYPGMTSIREKFINWMNMISNDASNIRASHLSYKCSIVIHQLNSAGMPAQSYTLVNAHPKDMSDIDLNMDSVDSLEEFTVSFSYSSFSIKNSLASKLLGAGVQVLGRFL